MGAFMVREGYIPDLVLCSTAVRATQTWELVQDQLENRPEVHFREDLYHGTPASVLELLRNVPDGFGTVLLVGHNPTWEDLALDLVLDGREAAMGQLHRKYPTGALAVIVFDGESWSEVSPGQGFLRDFVRPKALKL
jgi:phosphohistidine phosphatase